MTHETNPEWEFHIPAHHRRLYATDEAGRILFAKGSPYPVFAKAIPKWLDVYSGEHLDRWAALIESGGE